MYPGVRDYPKEIVVKDTPWNIKFCRKTPDDQPGEGLGLCDPETKTLYIRYKQSPRETFKTFVHEWWHAVEVEYEFDISHKLIYKFETIFTDLLENNPEFFIQFIFHVTGAK